MRDYENTLYIKVIQGDFEFFVMPSTFSEWERKFVGPSHSLDMKMRYSNVVKFKGSIIKHRRQQPDSKYTFDQIAAGWLNDKYEEPKVIDNTEVTFSGLMRGRRP